MRILLILLLAISLNAKSFLISNIPLPRVEVLNLNFKDFSDKEIEKLYEEGYILTLLSLNNLNEPMIELTQVHKQILNIHESIDKQLYKIAFFMPKKAIGKYATSTVNSAITTMLTHNFDFELTVYDAQEFDTSLQNIEALTHDIVIAPVTIEYAQRLCQNNLANRFYIPTVHAKNLTCDNKNVVFGAIDYQAQVNSFADEITEALTLVSNTSSVTSLIDGYVVDSYDIREHIVVTDAGNLKQLLTKNKEVLHEQTVFLNLPLIEATLFLSQLPLYEIEPKAIYATQILYNPNILKLTQYNDRKNILIANSIKKLDAKDIGNANLLRNDLRYDWVDFTTAYGFSKILDGTLENNQIEYEIEHVKALRRNFVTKEPN
jgi:hypothetical protein